MKIIILLLMSAVAVALAIDIVRMSRRGKGD